MTIVRRPSPFGELLSLRQAMDRLFEDSFVNPHSWGGVGAQAADLPLDIYTTADDLVLEAAMPGVKPEDVEITVTGDALTLSGRSNSERTREEGSVLVNEIRRGEFSRTVTLPQDLQTDRATADFSDGVLTLRIPKAEAVKPRQIRISTTGDGQPQSKAGLPEDGQR